MVVHIECEIVLMVVKIALFVWSIFVGSFMKCLLLFRHLKFTERSGWLHREDGFSQPRFCVSGHRYCCVE